MKRWSSLQSALYRIIDERLDFQIHLNRYSMDSRYGSAGLPRYWITFRGEIIFDYPKQFVDRNADGNCVRNLSGAIAHYPYETDVPAISELIRAYIDTPKETVFSAHFSEDHWGLINILKAADKRNGRRRLEILKRRVRNQAAQRIIAYRLEEMRAHPEKGAPECPLSD